jgi:hypothetical protein
MGEYFGTKIRYYLGGLIYLLVEGEKSQKVSHSTVPIFAAKYLCLMNLSYLSKITKLKL